MVLFSGFSPKRSHSNRIHSYILISFSIPILYGAFVRLLGASPIGHEEGILILMKKMDVRRVKGKEKENQGNFKFERDEKLGVDSQGEEEKKKLRTSKRGEGSLFSLLTKIIILS